LILTILAVWVMVVLSLKHIVGFIVLEHIIITSLEHIFIEHALLEGFTQIIFVA
jgi:hypothetical protein